MSEEGWGKTEAEWRGKGGHIGKAKARAAHDGPRHKRLEEDRCWIVWHVNPNTQSDKGLNWTELNRRLESSILIYFLGSNEGASDRFGSSAERGGGKLISASAIPSRKASESESEKWAHKGLTLGVLWRLFLMVELKLVSSIDSHWQLWQRQRSLSLFHLLSFSLSLLIFSQSLHKACLRNLLYIQYVYFFTLGPRRLEKAVSRKSWHETHIYLTPARDLLPM